MLKQKQGVNMGSTGLVRILSQAELGAQHVPATEHIIIILLGISLNLPFTSAPHRDYY